MNIGNMAKGMNDVDRFEDMVIGDVCGPRFEMVRHPRGNWVEHADYAALQQQLAAAREALAKESAMREEMADAVGILTARARNAEEALQAAEADAARYRHQRSEQLLQWMDGDTEENRQLWDEKIDRDIATLQRDRQP